MSKTGSKNFRNFLKKIKPRFSFHYIAYTVLSIFVIFSVVSVVTATTPNPGHPWSELGDGVFVFTNSQTVTPYTYTFPAANSTVLTTNAAVTVAQGGTGLGTVASGSVLAANSTDTLSAITWSSAGTKVLTNTSGTISWEDASGGSMVYPGAGIANSTGSAWGTSYSTSGSGTVVALATSPVLTTATITTSLLPTTDDGAPLGDATHHFSDLFLASGGVINWNAGNATLTHSTGLLTSNVPLSLGTSNALTTGTIELGDASANTLSASSGVLSIEGTAIPKGTGTGNEIAYWSGTNTIASLTTGTYPSLTELSYVKGVTSAIQTQIDGKLSIGLVSTITADPSPAVVNTTYYADASAAGFTVTLPDTSASNDGELIRIVLSDATNSINVTTTSGTDLIGTEISQSIVQAETGFTLQSDFTNTTWHIVQDSRAKAPNTSVVAYGLTESGAVGGYNKLAFSTSDSDYSLTATNYSVGTVTGSDILLGGWVGNVGEITGLINQTNVNLIFNTRKTAGTANAYFYVNIYHRNSIGTETLLGTSGISPVISSATYVEEEVSAIISTQNFVSTDYIVIKFYGTKSGAGTDPTYDVQLEGTSPARLIIPVSSSLVSHNNLARLQGGTSGQYYHLTNAEYTGLSGLSASELVGSDASGSLQSLSTTTYPSFTELSYVKGVTSALQTQLDAKAGVALDNLSSVAINTDLLLGTSDGGALGSATKMWSDLFLADGGVINWNNGNATLTHSTGLLTSNVPLSLGTTNALTTGTIELGHASDTTIARSGAGAITVEGTAVLLSGGALGTPSSGTVTNLTGTASININGTVGATTPTTGAFTTVTASSTLSSGTNGGTGGQLTLNGATSGSGVLQVAAVAGAGIVFQLPSANGSNTNILQTDGAGVTSWVTKPTSSQWTTTGSDIYYNTGRVFVGSTSEATSVSKLALTGTTNVDGSTAGVIGILGGYTFNPTAGGTQVGNRFVVTNSPTTTANTAVGQIMRVVDNTSLANLVRGVDVTSNAGSNTAGTNTGLRASGATFGLQGITTALAGGVSVPAAIYGESTGTTQGDVLRLYSDTVTSATSFATFYHDTSTFTGTGLLMDFATGSGSFTGNFADFQKNNTSLFVVTNGGIVSLGLPDNSNTATSALCSTVANATNPTADTAYQVRDCSGTPVVDYAEMFPVDTDIDYGDIVATGTEIVEYYSDDGYGNVLIDAPKRKVTKLIKSDHPYQRNTVGIISLNYGDFSSVGYNLIDKKDNPMPVALSGRVPVKISQSSESIKAGDYVTTSSDAGKATKATEAGFVIGKALEDWTPDQGVEKIIVFIEQGYYPGPEFNNIELGGLTFSKDDSSVVENIIFNEKVEFNLPPLFNNDTAGFAIIEKGTNKVEVVFDTPYIAQPVVSATISFEDEDNITEDEASTFFDDDIRSLIIDKSQNGFTIIINKDATRDVRFSWTALSVKNPKIFKSVIDGLTIEPNTSNNDEENVNENEASPSVDETNNDEKITTEQSSTEEVTDESSETTDTDENSEDVNQEETTDDETTAETPPEENQTEDNSISDEQSVEVGPSSTDSDQNMSEVESDPEPDLNTTETDGGTDTTN